MITNSFLMTSFLFIRAILIAAWLSAPLMLHASTRVPVLLELFTSEGCSSCPPADKLLTVLDREQPVEGAELIVLSEHVDYWNHLGWSDPFSSQAISQRQEAYAAQLGGVEIYTPQLVIDGAKQVVGSNWPSVKQAIAESIQRAKVPLQVTARKDGPRITLHLEISALTPGLPPAAQVFVVLAADHAHSKVFRGENAGRELDHVAIGYSFRKIGKLTADSPFEKDLDVRPDTSFATGPIRIIAFVQDPNTRHILGVAQAK
jgi:hypothetical protein